MQWWKINKIDTVNRFFLFTDSIEANVESTAVHVEDGNVQLEKARDYQVQTCFDFLEYFEKKLIFALASKPYRCCLTTITNASTSWVTVSGIVTNKCFNAFREKNWNLFCINIFTIRYTFIKVGYGKKRS